MPGRQAATSNYFDVQKWIKGYFNLSLSDRSLDNVNNSLEFIWVWSVFEHKHLKNSQNDMSFYDQLVKISNKLYNDDLKVEVNEIYGFFYNRYFQNKKTTRFFADLNLNRKWNHELKNILTNSNPKELFNLQSIFTVIYTFRCNLFHGGKNIIIRSI